MKRKRQKMRGDSEDNGGKQDDGCREERSEEEGSGEADLKNRYGICPYVTGSCRIFMVRHVRRRDATLPGVASSTYGC